MGKTTDELGALAQKISSKPPRHALDSGSNQKQNGNRGRKKHLEPIRSFDVVLSICEPFYYFRMG
jgi:hypothetical protein